MGKKKLPFEDNNFLLRRMRCHNLSAHLAALKIRPGLELQHKSLLSAQGKRSPSSLPGDWLLPHSAIGEKALIHGIQVNAPLYRLRVSLYPRIEFLAFSPNRTLRQHRQRRAYITERTERGAELRHSTKVQGLGCFFYKSDIEGQTGPKDKHMHTNQPSDRQATKSY